ncbi:YggL family protein [Morganella morganii]|uniref:YggL family protein n=1 Tax=Morganella morganii TaxID=582 RepID=UPI003EB8A43C
MATQRSRRLRKKMRIDEFRELGFSFKWDFPEGTDVDTIDRTVDQLVEEVIEPNGLALDASGYLSWEAMVCLQKIGECTDEHRKLVGDWLKAKGIQNIQMSELFDIWWD